MIHSLLIKFTLLAATALLIVWIGWPTAPDEPDPVESAVQALPASPEGPDQTEADRPADRPQGSTPDERRLDLNQASLEDLERLPGIGNVLAHRVVEWRHVHGRFRSVEELGKVKGIGARKLAQIKPLVTVGHPLKRTDAAGQTPMAMAQAKDGR